MTIILYNRDTFDIEAMKALKEKYPKDVVIDEHFNHSYQINFADGRFGFAGIANGPLEVDIYTKGFEQMQKTGQPDDWDTVAEVIYV